jgi:hypothetical protein
MSLHDCDTALIVYLRGFISTTKAVFYFIILMFRLCACRGKVDPPSIVDPTGGDYRVFKTLTPRVSLAYARLGGARNSIRAAINYNHLHNAVSKPPHVPPHHRIP